MGRRSDFNDLTLMPTMVVTENSTSGPDGKEMVTGILLEAADPKYIWLPHVLLSVVMIGLLAVSFINFHRKYKDRYVKRGQMARHESLANIHDGNGVSPHLNAIIGETYYTTGKRP